MKEKNQKTINQTLSYGNVYFAGKNYQFNFNSDDRKKYEVQIFEQKKTSIEVEKIENRQIKQSITTWKAIEKKHQDKVEKSLTLNIPIIDKKIQGIEVESAVIETVLIEPTKVVKLVDSFEKIEVAKIHTYCNLSSAAVRIFVLNYLKTI